MPALVPADLQALQLVEPGKPVVLALNMIDRLANPNLVLPIIDAASRQAAFAAIVPCSARTGAGIWQAEPLGISTPIQLWSAAPANLIIDDALARLALVKITP